MLDMLEQLNKFCVIASYNNVVCNLQTNGNYCMSLKGTKID